jgi:hypothetical protein
MSATTSLRETFPVLRDRRLPLAHA